MVVVVNIRSDHTFCLPLFSLVISSFVPDDVPVIQQWISQNRCPSHEAERVLDSFRHAAHGTLGRPQSALLARDEINSRRTLRHLQGLKGGWHTGKPRATGEIGLQHRCSWINLHPDLCREDPLPLSGLMVLPQYRL